MSDGSQTTISKPLKRSSNLTLILYAIIAVLLIIVGYLAYSSSQKQNQISLNPSSNSNSLLTQFPVNPNSSKLAGSAFSLAFGAQIKDLKTSSDSAVITFDSSDLPVITTPKDMVIVKLNNQVAEPATIGDLKVGQDVNVSTAYDFKKQSYFGGKLIIVDSGLGPSSSPSANP